MGISQEQVVAAAQAVETDMPAWNTAQELWFLSTSWWSRCQNWDQFTDWVALEAPETVRPGIPALVAVLTEGLAGWPYPESVDASFYVGFQQLMVRLFGEEADEELDEEAGSAGIVPVGEGYPGWYVRESASGREYAASSQGQPSMDAVWSFWLREQPGWSTDARAVRWWFSERGYRNCATPPNNADGWISQEAFEQQLRRSPAVTVTPARPLPGFAGWWYRLSGDTYQYRYGQNGDWGEQHPQALAPARPEEGRVIPVHEIPGWESLATQVWARNWYALPRASGYTYLRSGSVPDPQTPGWTSIPPAPPDREVSYIRRETVRVMKLDSQSPEYLAARAKAFPTVHRMNYGSGHIDSSVHLMERSTVGKVRQKVLCVDARPLRNTLFIFEPPTVNVTAIIESESRVTEFIKARVACFKIDSSSDVLMSGGGQVTVRVIEEAGGKVDPDKVQLSVGEVRYYSGGVLERTVVWRGTLAEG
jgi:hypothetical protein